MIKKKKVLKFLIREYYQLKKQKKLLTMQKKIRLKYLQLVEI